MPLGLHVLPADLYGYGPPMTTTTSTISGRTAARLEPMLRGADGPLAFRRWHFVLLLGITALAAMMRLYKIGEWSFWVDEGHTWRDVTLPLWRFRESARGWYPLSYLGLRWSIEFLGLPDHSEGWLRLPYALFGIASVPLLAVFGQKLVGRRAALLAALFLGINPWHIYWSQNARAYVLVFFFAVLSAGSYWLAIERRSWRWSVVSGVALLIAGACHFTGFALLPAFLAYPLLSGRELTPRWVGVGVLLAFAASLAVPYVLELLPPFQAFQRAKPDASLLHMLQTTAWYFRLPLLLAAGVGLWMLLQGRMQGRALFLACWAVIPLLSLCMVGSSLVKVTARYALCALPAVLLLAGGASVRMAEVLSKGLGRTSWVSRAVPAMVLPALLCFDMISYNYLYYTVQRGDRGRYREAAELVEAKRGERPATVLTVNEPSLIYYLRPDHFRHGPVIDPVQVTQVIPIETWEVFPDPARPETQHHNGYGYLRSVTQDIQKQGRDVFVVVTLPELKEKDQDGTLLAAVEDMFEVVGVLPCWVGPKDETIFVYKLRR